MKMVNLDNIKERTLPKTLQLHVNNNNISVLFTQSNYTSDKQRLPEVYTATAF